MRWAVWCVVCGVLYDGDISEDPRWETRGRGRGDQSQTAAGDRPDSGERREETGGQSVCQWGWEMEHIHLYEEPEFDAETQERLDSQVDKLLKGYDWTLAPLANKYVTYPDNLYTSPLW